MDYNVRHIDPRAIRCPLLFSGVRSMSNKIKGRQRRRLSLASDDVHVLTAVAACGVSGYLFWEMKFAKPTAEVAQGEVETAPAPRR